ncbi:MAG: hypothetical protein LBC75_08060 [Fibromonadaceae bacterium]|jgi:uncharacterized protein (TIGR02145 family)|nr:hypothetical protein [Fibromonadaceae bacterium]
MVLRFFFLAFLLISCATPERDNPYDPDGINFQGDKISSSVVIVPSSSSVSVMPSSSSVTQIGVIHGDSVYYEDETYKTVVIGSQTWMARNLNYNASGSKCNNCATYGRLYDWATAMALDASCNSSTCASQVDAKHKGICPRGWHIPSNAEWRTLIEERHFILKANSPLWNSDGKGTSTDDFGFSALPGGYGISDGTFESVGYFGYWWSATENDNDNSSSHHLADCWSISYRYHDIFRRSNVPKDLLHSVRCIKD